MASDNFQKLWLQDSLNRVAARRVADEIDQQGRALPCRVTAVNGSIVTVAFEVNAGKQTLPSVTIPKAESQWLRSPTQIGDTGLTIPADVYLGGISGLGGGVADLSRRANLTALMFLPCGSTSFSAVNANAAYIAGLQGAVIRTVDGASVVTINQTEINLVQGSNSVLINSSGVTITGVLTINGHPYLAHIHSGVTTGSSDTGGVV